MKKVYICSPYREITTRKNKLVTFSLESNIEIAQHLCEVAIFNGYLPLAPHLYFTQFLNDDKPAERELGLKFAEYWINESDQVWVYSGRGITEGMRADIWHAQKAEKRILYWDWHDMRPNEPPILLWGRYECDICKKFYDMPPAILLDGKPVCSGCSLKIMEDFSINFYTA